MSTPLPEVTRIVQRCEALFEDLHFNAVKAWKDGAPGAYQLIDLDLSRYDRIARRFARVARYCSGPLVSRASIETSVVGSSLARRARTASA